MAASFDPSPGRAPQPGAVQAHLPHLCGRADVEGSGGPEAFPRALERPTCLLRLTCLQQGRVPSVFQIKGEGSSLRYGFFGFRA